MPKIFKESVLAGMTFSNRIIRAATHEGMADECGRPLEELAKVYTRLALGGVGAIITGFAAVQKNGRVSPNTLMFDKGV